MFLLKYLPLYQQVLEDIKAEISSGTYASGQRIPSEAELSQLYSVSRVTVRRAIEELVGEGYLTKRQGKGTYVNQRKMTRKIRQCSTIESFTDVCAEMGMKAGAHVIERRVVPARTEEQRLFGPGHDPYDGFEFLLTCDLENTSFFAALREGSGRVPTSCASSTIEVALASAAMAKNLDIAIGDPLFFEHVVFLDQDGKTLCVSSKYLVGSRYMFDI